MAKYFLYVKVFSRGEGSRVTRAAAYRAGERIRDERTSEVYNYSGREDVLHKEAVLWIHSRCSLALSRSHMQVAAGAAARKANYSIIIVS